ncbi:MAG: Rrf2 family transcriptional regulator [Firmicutes bacterium HGW-Firmicutes-15]|nr:MAG: Rrf2 family transcriptional regulator [Firmicutes bacterium HGW-Firmicutes-15]
MNINQASDYGFRAVLYLAQAGTKVVEAQTIAQNEVVPMRYLLKIMPSLIKAGIVRSQRGVGGGYALARDPRDITLLDVIEAIEGPIRLNRCLLDEGYCSKQGPPDCKIHQALADIQQKLDSDLSSYNFADFLE